MANNLIQVKRTSVSGRAANSTTLPNPGELALNMTDGILYSTNGSVVFEVGANNTNAKVTNTLTVNAISANGGVGTNNQVLTSNGSRAYWKDNIIKDLNDVAANGATSGQVLTYSTVLSKWINQDVPTTPATYVTGYYASYFDNAPTQNVAAAATATVMKFANTYLQNGMTYTANDEIQVGYTGVYEIKYSVQLQSSANKNENVRIWLRKNGTDIVDSTSDFGIYAVAGGTNGYLIATTPFVTQASAGDKYQVMWAVSNTLVNIITVANTAYAPESPGTILTITPVSSIITAPPGNNTDIIFNDSGVSNALSGFTYTKTTNSVTVANNLYIGNTVNAAAFTVDNQFWANSTVVNSTTFQVDGHFSANSTLVNAAAILVRGGATVNGTLTLNDGLSANGGVGSAGQILFTDGSKAYWNSASFGSSTNVDAQYIWTNTHTFQNAVTFQNTVTLGNSTVNATINSTFFTGTANNVSYVGTVSAVNVVSNAQLSGNLANYQTTAGLSANVATLTSNNATHAFGKTEGNLNVNSAVSATNANNSTYVYGKVEGDLNVNSAVYANNSTYAYGKTEGNLNVNNATYAYGKTEGNLNVNSAVYANNSTYAFGKTEGNLNVNSAVHANNSAYAFGKTEDNLNVNSAVSATNANNATYAYGKTEGNLNVNNALTSNYASYINANTGIVSNSSGVFVNSVYIDTLGASSLGGSPAANFVQNTDSRILSGNLNFTGANNVFDTKLTVNATTINATGVYTGNLVGNVSATTISGNLTGNVAATTISGNLTGNVSATTINTSSIGVSGNVTVGANVSLNTSVLAIGNSTANVYVNSTAFIGNVAATTISGNLTGNVVATTISGNLTGNVSATNLSGNLFAITANVENKLQVGAGHVGNFDFGSNAVVEIDANGNTYVQVVLQNGNTGNNASADLVITNDTGNDSFNYIDLGINGSNYNQAGFSISGPSDAYLYASDGNLAIGTAKDKELVFHANGTTTSDRKLTINATALTVANNVALVANGSTGTAGHVLHSNSTGVYWAADDAGVTSVASGNGITGGTITSTGTLSVTQGTGVVVNTSGVHVNASYINTISANSATYLGAAGNFGNSTGVYTSGLVNATTVNATTVQVGTNFVANSTQVTAADLLVTGNLIVNGTTVTLNTATLDVKDLNITLAKGTASAAAANGAGITVDGAAATLTYINPSNTWLSNINFTVGNTSSNVSVNSTAFVGNVVATTITGNLTGNVSAVSISGNLTGNVVATTISGNLTGNVVAGTVNATSVNATSNIVVGANVSLNTSVLSIGNTVANVYVNSTAFVGNVVATSLSGNLTGNVAATTISGNLTGNVAATTISGNLTGNVVATTISGNLTGNVSATVVSASANVSIGNSTVNVYANSSTFVGNTTGVHTGNVSATTISGNLTGNVVATTISGNLTGNVVATTISGNLTGNVAATTISGNLTGNVVATNVNAATVQVSTSITLDNDRNLQWKAKNTSTVVGMRQQSDDNFVFYSTDATYAARPVFAIYANSSTSNLQMLVPLNIQSSVGANGSFGSAGQVLTTSGSGVYWSTVSGGGGSVNVAAQYAWTNTQSFAANLTITANAIGLTTNSSGIYFNGTADANWRIGRNTGGTTKWFYTGNSVDIIAANTATEGIVFGFTGNSYLETGYNGTYVKDRLVVGNSTVSISANATNFVGNVTATSISGNLTGNVVAGTVNATTINATSTIVVGSNLSINTSVISVGNSTANVYVNSTAHVGNVVATTITGNLTGNVVATTISGNLTGNVTATTISGNLTAITANVTNKLQIGAPGSFDFGSNAVIEVDANGNTYVQAVLQNANTGNNASADLVVTNDTGNDSFNYIDLGINGSNYNQAGFNITGASDAYLYASHGNLAIGTASAKDIIFHAGGTTASDRKMTINTTAVSIGNSTSNVSINSIAFVGNVVATAISGNLTGNVVATTISGNLTGNVVATTISGNLTGNVVATTISGNLTGNVSATTISASANIAVGANVLITTANLAIGNSTANVYVNSTAFVGNVVATSVSGNLSGNVTATVISSGNVTVTGFVNATSTLAAGNTTITGFTNASGNGQFSGNVGIGIIPNSTVALYTAKTWASDSVLYGHVTTMTDSNTAMTAARSKFSDLAQVYNLNQNKSSDGLTSYNTYYIAQDGDAYNGSPVTGGDARTYGLFGGQFRAFNYANGVNANTVDLARGATGYSYQYGSGVITTAYGLVGGVAIGNSSVTGNVTTAFGMYSELVSNTAATIASGYLYYGNHLGSTTTNKWGIYLTGETKSYFSGNVGIGNTAPTHKLSVNGTTYLGANLTLISTAAIVANSTAGTNGQVLTSNGSVTYWSTPVAAVNVAAQYAWTNTHTYAANVTVGSSTNNSAFLTSYFGMSNPNTFTMGAITTTTGINTVLAGPYVIATGNTLTIATGSRVVIV